jgi:Domain of unknown function (DUF5916)/Carbohydrate family 9 binding domain-like
VGKTVLLAVSLLAVPCTSPAADERPPIPITRAAGAIVVDGDLSDPGWQGATVIDRFYEGQPGDNVEPKVRTVGYVTYDDKYFYIGVRCDDPDPRRIRAPYVERDAVIGTDDNVAIFLDTRNDRRSAVELRVNPRGIQGDAVFNDATSNEDFSPDFFYDSAAKITEQGWVAELRVPFSTLRYPRADPQTWGLMIWRNYPREFRYGIYSTPQPRGSNCYICRLAPVTGLRGLPSASSLLFVPYATAQNVARAAAPGEALGKGKFDRDAGLDFKWTPSADTAVDLTLNPDFSQVEADVAQIAANQRFALFFPEKRPFFLEGVDLFDTPLQAVYTRTVTDPRGGGRATGKFGGSTYTVLLAQDRGGGSVVIPGLTSSDFAPQDFRSWVGVGRLRHDLGNSFVGLLATGRQIEDGGHNLVVGPDFQWRPSQKDRLTGQFLWSATETPDRPALAAEWDGRRLGAGAMSLAWNHNTRGFNWFGRYRELGEDFRADEGFIPQVGYREGRGNFGYNFWPNGFLRQANPYVGGNYTTDRGGHIISSQFFPGFFVQGRKNLAAEVDLNFNRDLTGDRVLSTTNLFFFAQFDPSRRFSRVGVNGNVGEMVDVDNVRVGRGVDLNASATFRPSVHLTLTANSALRWLNVDRPEPLSGRGRLFLAQVQRLKATYNLTARAFLRAIGQYVTTRREPSLFTFPVRRKSGSFSGSALFSYRLNWQTALFVGYGDDRVLTATDVLARTGRQLFFKLSYAFLR